MSVAAQTREIYESDQLPDEKQIPFVAALQAIQPSSYRFNRLA